MTRMQKFNVAKAEKGVGLWKNHTWTEVHTVSASGQQVRYYATDFNTTSDALRVGGPTRVGMELSGERITAIMPCQPFEGADNDRG